jgi:hypothetical protein
MLFVGLDTLGIFDVLSLTISIVLVESGLDSLIVYLLVIRLLEGVELIVINLIVFFESVRLLYLCCAILLGRDIFVLYYVFTLYSCSLSICT